MRKRNEEINVRVCKTEKNIIRRKAKRCGMNVSEYLRTLGTGTEIREAPSEKLAEAYQKLVTFHDAFRYESWAKEYDRKLTEIEELLLQVCLGEEEEPDGGDENLGGA